MVQRLMTAAPRSADSRKVTADVLLEALTNVHVRAAPTDIC